MMRKRVKISRRRPVDEPEIIVIPMIDVMMFLLFFFMVASLAMVVQNAIPVNLPKASTSQEENAQTVTITLKPDGGVYVNTKRVTMGQLAPTLQSLKVGPKNVVTMNSDEHVPYGTVVAAMNEARKAGVQLFAFATNKS
jgi:biopolymer transport protein ExbD